VKIDSDKISIKSSNMTKLCVCWHAPCNFRQLNSLLQSDDTRGCTYTVMTWTAWRWAGLMLETCGGF